MSYAKKHQSQKQQSQQQQQQGKQGKNQPKQQMSQQNQMMYQQQYNNQQQMMLDELDMQLQQEMFSQGNGQQQSNIDMMSGGYTTQYSQKSRISNIGPMDDISGGESVRVCVRVRPMNNLELQRNDPYCIKHLDQQSIQLNQKGQVIKHYRFNYSLQDNCSQPEVFESCNISDLLISTLDGYSATIFAYGQTGSGKTYTMAGVEEKLGREVYISDETEGIIPRSFRFLWQAMAQRNEQFYVKASFAEIYNEQLCDLLNPSSGILHCRWNAKNGFFVEDLMVVEVTSVDDLIAVLHEGNKHRKIGSHQLNKDSSRSHSILTVYVISEVVSDNNVLKRYGKISFVDLAGSERLKESQSKGEMVKETGNINKSLFTLGKVISMLTDKKNKQQFIPYRDSKLTMLLMDSLGGSAKALMIACVSPSEAYLEETLNTLNYATRTMNIKNKPIVSMDPKDQIIFGLNKQADLLKMENSYLTQQLNRVSQGLPFESPPPEYFKQQNNKKLPPLQPGKSQSNSRPISHTSNIDAQQQQQLQQQQQNQDIPINKVIDDYQTELQKLKKQNDDLREIREEAEANYHRLMNDNNQLQIKLENLENVFLGQQGEQKGGQKLQEKYMAQTLLNENQDLKKKIKYFEEENQKVMYLLKEQANLNDVDNMSNQQDQNEILQLRQVNKQLNSRMDYLAKRERDLLDNLLKLQKKTGVGKPKQGQNQQQFQN